MTEHIRNELIKYGLLKQNIQRDPEVEWGNLDPCEDWRLLPDILLNAMENDYGVVIGTVGSIVSGVPIGISARVQDWRTGKQSMTILSKDGRGLLTPWCICAALLDACITRSISKDIEHDAASVLGLVASPQENKE